MTEMIKTIEEKLNKRITYYKIAVLILSILFIIFFITSYSLFAENQILEGYKELTFGLCNLNNDMLIELIIYDSQYSSLDKLDCDKLSGFNEWLLEEEGLN